MTEILFARFDELSNANNLTTGKVKVPFSQTIFMSGTGTASNPANYIQVSDNMAITSSSTDANGNFTPEGWYNLTGLQVDWTGAGTLSTGARAAILGNVFLKTPTNPSNATSFFVGEILTTNIYSDDNGTAGTPKGGAFGLATVTYLGPNVKHWGNMLGAELDLVAAAGSSVGGKVGVLVSSFTGDAVQGVGLDAGFILEAVTGTPGFRNAFVVANAGASALSADGTLLGTLGSNTFTNAVDVSSSTITGFFFKSTKFNVAAVGSIGGQMVVSSNSVATAPNTSIIGNVNARFMGPDGGANRLVVDSFGNGANPGVAAAFSTVNLRRANGTGAAPSAVKSGDLIFGYVGVGYGATTFKEGGGAGITGWASENYTDSASGAELVLVVTPNGSVSNSEAMRVLNTGQVKFTGAANFSANGAIATVLGSVGPTGSHTTVQEWLTFQNASGVTRYVPAF